MLTKSGYSESSRRVLVNGERTENDNVLKSISDEQMYKRCIELAK